MVVAIALSKDQLRVEPGNAATINVTVRNSGSSADRFELEVHGLDSEWVAVPSPSFTLAPGEERQQKLLIKPPRTAESKAGTYPFLIRARSLETGKYEEVQGVLEIEPFHLISLEIEPRRAHASISRKQANFNVTAINLGNADETLQFFADDPEDECTYQFAQERIPLAPGQQKQVTLQVQPKHLPVVGAPRLYGFSVSARGIENPHVVASIQGQIERRPLVTLTMLAMLIIILVAVGVWYALRPTYPRMESFAADSVQVPKGENVRLTWTASPDTKSVRIEGNGKVLFAHLPHKGEVFVPINETTTFTATAINDLGESRVPMTVTVTAIELPPPQLPEIEEFALSPTKVVLGNSVVVRYKVKNATKVLLQPLGIELPVNLEDYSFTPSQTGKLEFTLVAMNREGKATRKTATIIIEPKSQAKIFSFRALFEGEPVGDKLLEPGSRIVLEWHQTGAERLEITPDVGEVQEERGSVEVLVDKTTEFTLTAIDSEGISVSKKITVKVKPPTIGTDG